MKNLNLRKLAAAILSVTVLLTAAGCAAGVCAAGAGVVPSASSAGGVKASTMAVGAAVGTMVGSGSGAPCTVEAMVMVM